MANPLIGKGWAFPVQIDGRGGISLAVDQTDLDQSIRVILSTRLGERVMRPDFGCRIHELTFAPINAQTIGLVHRYVEEAIGWWEPRIDLEDIEVTTDPAMRSAGKLLIQIRYRVRTTKDERSLVYPFYLISPEA